MIVHVFIIQSEGFDIFLHLFELSNQKRLSMWKHFDVMCGMLFCYCNKVAIGYKTELPQTML